ncbi:MAG: hypothetical protein Q8936_01395 [Bacillota bacterium]|nr:hypothetical protein [Bacillota bacterium]
MIENIDRQISTQQALVEQRNKYGNSLSSFLQIAGVGVIIIGIIALVIMFAGTSSFTPSFYYVIMILEALMTPVFAIILFSLAHILDNSIYNRMMLNQLWEKYIKNNPRE